MNTFQEISLFTHQLQLLQDEYKMAPVHIQYDILHDIQLLQDALMLLQSSAG